MKNPLNWIIAILAIAVGYLLFDANGWRLQWPVASVNSDVSAAVATSSVPTSAVPATAAPSFTGWVGDQMGPEKGFPDTVSVPAIAEIYDQSTQYCATIAVNASETLTWSGSGAYWESLVGQAAIDARFAEHHVKEYLKKYPNCEVFYSVAEFLRANPTFR